MQKLPHELSLETRRDEKARAAFVRQLRRHVMNDLAASLESDYRSNVEPRMAPGGDIHRAMRERLPFQFYSTLRTTSQDLLYQIARPVIERDIERLHGITRRLEKRKPALGSLQLAEAFQVPRSVSALDIHLMPGSYHTEYGEDDLTMGAVYENRLAVSTFGLFGPNLDDIGRSLAMFVKEKMPDLRPTRILDLGCTVGHNTGAWKDVFPQAEVHGIDVAAACLRYARARALSQSRAVHFKQMDAANLAYPDAHFDIVFSSMFLHEVPARVIPRVMAEAHRVLRPGGLMLHMELPPADQLSAWESFYLDWDGHYNNEPFYRSFRAQHLQDVVAAAGFERARYLQHVVPSINALGDTAWRAALDAQQAVDSAKTGRLASGIRWFCFGARKTP
jgi:ubiquinone/menaquinone biosynthesis C-methylase UbiE